MKRIPLKESELNTIAPGEAITLATVMLIVIAAAMAVVVFKMLTSSAGTVKVPGGYSFTWK